MSRVLRGCSIGVVMLFLTSAIAYGQATAQLSGRVTDDSGGVLPGVSVTVVQTDTGFTRTTVTDDSGTYVLPNLPIGPYRLEVMLAGFRAYVQTGIVLQVAATPAINVTLGLGELAETVTVEAAAPLVDTQSAGIGEVVEQERILELPLQGRQVTDLIFQTGAAVDMGRPNNRSFQGGVNISVAGGLAFGVSYLLDGALHNDPQNAAGLALPFPDAVQEFRVTTSGTNAENGVRSGASVSAVTKSGTNRFSGNAFEFYRDAKFNAISRFAPIGPDGEQMDDGLTRHQFGGTFGGPIKRDRMFFFGAYQQTETTQQPASLLARVPDGSDARRGLHLVCLGRLSGWYRGDTAGALRRQPHQSGGVQPGRVEPHRAPAEDDGSVRRDALFDSARPFRGTVCWPRRFPAECQPFDLRPLHDHHR